DVCQAVFTRVYDRLDALRDDASVRPWIAQLTRRLCLDRLAAERREQPAEGLLTAETEAALADLDEAFSVHEAMSRLPEPCREVLDRFFTRDESYRTIRHDLNLTPGSAAH